MYRRIIKDSIGILASIKPSTLKKHCTACSHSKLITCPSISKSAHAILQFLDADACGPIEPPNGPFGFFLAIVDLSSKWSQVSLLSTRNTVFARILANILRRRAKFPNSPIRTLRVRSR
jgi:hypothetical protein